MSLSINTLSPSAHEYLVISEESRSIKPTSNTQSTTGAGTSDLDNRNSLIQILAGLEQGITTRRTSNEHILPALQTTKIQLEPNTKDSGPTIEVSLGQYITANGWSIPKNLEELTQLRQTVSSLAPQSTSNAYAAITEQVAKANVERAKFNNIALGTAAAFPDVRAEAKKCAQDIVFKLTGVHVDADKVYLNRFNGTQSATTATGWEHMKEEPTSSISLTDAVLKNFSEYDGVPGTLDSEAGLYKDGPGQSKKAGYGAHNQIPLAPSGFMKALWKADFQTIMAEKIDNFWEHHTDNYRAVQKGVFIYKASEQLKSQEAKLPAELALQPPEHQFTRRDYKQLMTAVCGEGVSENQPLTFAQLQATSPVTGAVEAHTFDINGFQSNDIVRFTLPGEGPKKYFNGRLDGVQILYIPDAQPAFLKFSSLEKMDQWVSDQAKTPQTRKALESHFSLADRQDHDAGDGVGAGLFRAIVPLGFLVTNAIPTEGIDTSLEYLGTGSVSNQEGKVIDHGNFSIKGDVFSHTADLSQLRMKSDADSAIKSNSEVMRDTWLNDISVGAALLVKLAPLGAPIAAAAVVTGLTEIALGTEKNISGDTQAERHDGALKTWDGMLNTLFSSLGASSTAEDPFILPQEESPALESTLESASGPGNIGLDVPNRLQPSQAGNISAYAVADGESLLAKSTPNAKGIYQFKDEVGKDRWFIRYTDQTGIAKTYEIRGDFKLSDGYVQIVDPQSDKPILTVNAGADGQWYSSRMLGGVKGNEVDVSVAQKRPAGPNRFSGPTVSKRPKLPEAFPGEKATLEPPVKGKNVFYKYNNQSRHSAFVADRSFSPSSTDLKGGPLPKGQGRHYFTDLAPEDKPTEVISQMIFGRNKYGKTLNKMTDYFEVNTTGLELVKVPGHPHIFYVETPFSIPLQYRDGASGELMNRVIFRGETPYTA